MILIGEKLNSSIPSALKALEERDEKAVLELAKRQLDGGAEYLDLNTALCHDETAAMVWAGKLITGTYDCGIMADSPNPNVISGFIDAVNPKKCIINSVTLESERFDAIVPIVKSIGCGVVAMPVSEGGMPHGAEERVKNISELISKLTAAGIPIGDIYADIIVEAVAADSNSAKSCLNAARELRSQFTDVHLLAGLSNVSFGLPDRAVLNRAFACMLVAFGVDSAILNTADADMVLTVMAAELFMGGDEYCMNYLSTYRALKK